MHRGSRSLVLALALLLPLAGCKSMWQSIKSASAPAAGAGGGAAIGTLFPPFGPIIGAAIGAVITHALAENAALRSGEIVGEDALEKEQFRWRGKTPQEWAEYAEGTARAASWAEKWKWRILWGGIAYIVFLRRRYVWELFTKSNVKSRAWAFVHALIGANWTRTMAYGFDPVAEGLASHPTTRSSS